MTNNTVKPKIKFQKLGNHGKANWIISHELVYYESAADPLAVVVCCVPVLCGRGNIGGCAVATRLFDAGNGTNQ